MKTHMFLSVLALVAIGGCASTDQAASSRIPQAKLIQANPQPPDQGEFRAEHERQALAIDRRRLIQAREQALTILLDYLENDDLMIRLQAAQALRSETVCDTQIHRGVAASPDPIP